MLEYISILVHYSPPMVSELYYYPSFPVDQQAKPVCVACSGGQVTCEMLPRVSVCAFAYWWVSIKFSALALLDS